MKEHFEIGETAVTVISDEQFIKVAKDAIFDARAIIEKKISEDPFFGTTYEPYFFTMKDDPLIRRMCKASVLAGVGPMAGVAGAVAVYAVEAMVSAGATFAIIENGGDIALQIDRDISVGMFQDDEKLRSLALHIPKKDRIFGICSSSGKIGPSVSFGKSGICTVFSDDVILADACATALGNLLKTGESEEMTEALERIGSIDGVDGCIASMNGLVAIYGNVPEFTKGKYSSDDASRIIYQDS